MKLKREKGYYKKGTKRGFYYRGRQVIWNHIRARGSRCEHRDEQGRRCTYTAEPWGEWRWHHRPGEQKLFRIAKGSQLPVKEIERELQKCDLLCREHHRGLHQGRG